MNTKISDLLPVTPGPIAAGTLLEVASPTGGTPAYVSKSATGDDVAGGGATDGQGQRPASTSTAGWRITSNYGGFGEVDLWSTVEAAGPDNQGFYFYQKLTSTTEQLLAILYGNATFTELDYISGTNFTSVYVDSSETNIGTVNAHPLKLTVQNVTRVTLPVAGGAVVIGEASADGFAINAAVAVATLPASPTLGMQRVVNNALSPAIGSVVAAGGAARALVWYNGAAWTVIGV